MAPFWSFDRFRFVVASNVGILAIALVGCASSSGTEDDEATSVAALDRPITLWCLEPAGHAVNGVDTVWTVDVTSAFGPPRDRFVQKDQGFYWHGPLLSRTGAPGPTWKMGAVDETHGFQTRAESEAGAIEVNLTGDPSLGFAGVTGTLRILPENGPEQVVQIVRGHVCREPVSTGRGGEGRD